MDTMDGMDPMGGEAGASAGVFAGWPRQGAQSEQVAEMEPDPLGIAADGASV